MLPYIYPNLVWGNSPLNTNGELKESIQMTVQDYYTKTETKKTKFLLLEIK